MTRPAANSRMNARNMMPWNSCPRAIVFSSRYRENLMLSTRHFYKLLAILNPALVRCKPSGTANLVKVPVPQ